jgi:beta-lactam-binding protein with PASTA domain
LTTSVAGPTNTPLATTPVTAEVTPPATPAIMPNVVCMNLQDAQDTIQSAGVFFSRSADATGAGRRQLVDSNWIVVDQTPSAGSPFGEIEAVLSAVKIGEPNPC